MITVLTIKKDSKDIETFNSPMKVWQILNVTFKKELLHSALCLGTQLFIVIGYAIFSHVHKVHREIFISLPGYTNCLPFLCSSLSGSSVSNLQ